MATKNFTATPKKTLLRFQLVKAEICEETIAALEQILNGARLLEVNGIAFAASLKNMRYVTDTTGYCRENRHSRAEWSHHFRMKLPRLLMNEV